MNYRLNTKVIAAVAVLVIIAIVLFVYTLVRTPTQESLPVPEDVDKAAQQVPERILTAKQAFVDGVHTIAGTIDLPTPCHTLVAEPFFTDESRTTVEIRFNTALEGDTCAAVVTPVPFKVTFEAPENVAIQATWDGVEVRLNLIPLAPGESLDDELYIKG